jgi:hypothetical protein|nr:MAG TPA: hypothetical protein [Caudoviricetes sp.]
MFENRINKTYKSKDEQKVFLKFLTEVGYGDKGI